MVRKILKRIIRKGVVVLVIGGVLSVNILSGFAEETENIEYVQEDTMTEDTLVISEESAVPEVPIAPEPPAIPEQPVEPETPSNPEKPVEPETPSNPEKPVEPETPSNPEKPVEPETPSNPEKPVEPETPSNPEKPVEPETPSNPEKPVEPETPSNPEKPVEPETPSNPEKPVEPETPSNPEKPVVPEVPGDMEKPIDPETPVISEIPEISEDSAYPALPTITDVSNMYMNHNGTTGSGYPTRSVFNAKEKIKNNTELPIEGLPPFITQEMVSGALRCQEEAGFPASVTIAQIIQESGFGQYGASGENGQGLSYLAYHYNNLFGIKGVGTAGSVNMETGEETDEGASFTISAGFRVYNTYSESIGNRTELLKEVYGDLIEKATDANSFAMQIGSRWATDNHYGESLIYQMERYDLYRLDKISSKEFGDLIGRFADPCPGASLTSAFGYREFRNSNHTGIDLGTGVDNIPTYAADDGIVVIAAASDSAGNWVVIDHGNGLVSKYMHHDRIYVEVGQKVIKGQQIGLSGTTGDSTGNHLHFQVEENGIAVNPMKYLENKM